MFDALSNRLQDVFQSLKGETRLTPEAVEAALREAHTRLRIEIKPTIPLAVCTRVMIVDRWVIRYLLPR